MDGSAPEVRLTVVLGIGNLLLSDDGIGIHVTEALSRDAPELPLNIRDGGTIGLSLLAEIDPEAELIAVDAMELHAAPGTLRVFKGADMDRQLTGTKRSAHEVALADLMQAADLAGCGPRRRALVAIQPETTTWGLTPTPAVAAAIPQAVQAVRDLLEEWRNER
ncbi:hydrogenase maturation protease [Acidimangrovimonas pyrenivorans]|uniref:Hydrogenase maturation protease n=1 Tax=Acidimangrovimonas pyrenivorans TaxID=2030798 RepID=A0ABV7AKK2_9RHOB